MKRFLVGLMILSSFTAHAGEVVNKKTGERLTALCTKLDDTGVCQQYRISKINETISSVEEIAFLNRRVINNPQDQFTLREKIKKFKYMPATDFMYGGLDDKVPMATGGVVIAGIPLMLGGSFLQATGTVAGATILGVGGAMTWGGLVVFFVSPIAIDIVSMPVRAIIKGIQIKVSKNNETFSYETLKTLLDDGMEDLELSNHKFKKVLKTYKTLKN